MLSVNRRGAIKSAPTELWFRRRRCRWRHRRGRRGRWGAGSWATQLDAQVIESGEVFDGAAGVQVGTGDDIARLHEWQFGREREIGRKDHILARDLDIVDGGGTLLHGRDAQYLTPDGLCRPAGGRARCIISLRGQPLLVVLQGLPQRWLELHVAAVQVARIDNAHILEDVPAAGTLHKDGHPGGRVVNLVQLDARHVIAANISAGRLDGILYVAADPQAREGIEKALVFVGIEEKDARTGIIV